MILALLGIVAQLRVVQPAPDCRVFRSALDNPYDDTHLYSQPRIAWHVERMVAGALLTRALVKARVPARVARWAPAALSLALHVRGYARKAYPVNPGDWLADAFTFSASNLPLKVVAVAYLPAACLSSP